MTPSDRIQSAWDEHELSLHCIETTLAEAYEALKEMRATATAIRGGSEEYVAQLREACEQAESLSVVLDDLGVPPGNLVDRVQTMREREAGEVNAALLEACKAMLGEPGPHAPRRTLAEAEAIRARASAAIEAAEGHSLLHRAQEIRRAQTGGGQ